MAAILGIITSIGGPWPRDLLAGDVPLVLRGRVARRKKPVGFRHFVRGECAPCACWQVGKEKGFTQMHTDIHRYTQMYTDTNRLNKLSETVLGCAFTVLNMLGAGFLEKVCENALAHERRERGLAVAQQRGITITYDGMAVGEYFVDSMVEEKLLIELKTTKALDDARRAQCINYFMAIGLRLCLLLNFGKPRLEIRPSRIERPWYTD